MFAAAARRLAMVAATGVRTYASEAATKKGVSHPPHTNNPKPHPATVLVCRAYALVPSRETMIRTAWQRGGFGARLPWTLRWRRA